MFTNLKKPGLIIVLIVVTATFISDDMKCQNSVSIGTEAINENAVLQLVSTGNNQGFLAPRVTTAQRLAMNLGNDDNGMLVFDNTMHSFYYWHNGQWYPLGANQNTELNLGLDINGTRLFLLNNGEIIDSVVLWDATGDTDNDPFNEIQDLQLSGNRIWITNNPSPSVIDLSSYLDNTDNQLLDFDTLTNVLSVTGGNSIDLTGLGNDDDADPDNEIQNLSQVLQNGNDAGNMRITDMADPVDNQDAATKNYVDRYSMPAGIIVMWSGTLAGIPGGWALCDGSNGTPDLRDRFILSVSDDEDPGSTGGNSYYSLTGDQLPSHSHEAIISNAPDHNHGPTGPGGTHNHTVSGGDHSHYLDDSNQLDGGGPYAVIESTDDYVNTSYDGITLPGGGHSHTVSMAPNHVHTTASAGAHSHTITINNTGNGSPVDNRPAYYKLAFIIKL
ncbi:MAG: hypothetical protein JW973_07200 [Bacteroidales bacterium]|nr:hypothetical protein [Bacteroidales bacterium]